MKSEQVDEFERDRLKGLRGALDAAAVESIRAQLWEIAEKQRGPKARCIAIYLMSA